MRLGSTRRPKEPGLSTSSLRRRSRGPAILACALSIAALTPATALSHADAVEVVSTSDEIALYGSTSASFQDMLITAIRDGQLSVADAQTTVAALLAEAQAGQDVEIPHTDGSLSDVDELVSILNALREEQYNPGHVAISTADPSNYPRAGVPVHDRYAWQLYVGVDAFVCAPSCDTTDKVRVRFTINPSRSSDKMDYLATYFPKSSPPKFSDIYATVGAYSARGVNLGDRNVGDDGSRDGSGSGSAVLQHDPHPGSALQELVRLHFHYNPADKTDYDRARTGLADCGTGDNLNCRYRPVTAMD